MSESLILEEEIDEAYDPTEDEILDYAKWLGMKLPEDRDFIYIAKEGLKAPLPSPWKACQNKEGEIYFFNFESGESVWDHPCDKYYKDLFQEAKNKNVKLKQTKSETPSKSPAKPVTKSPTKFEKTDPLLEITQLEKENKRKIAENRERYEYEFEEITNDLNREARVEITVYKDKLDKELRKNLEKYQKDLIELSQSIEKSQISDTKTQAIIGEHKTTVSIERKKYDELLSAEIEQFKREQTQITQLEISCQMSIYNSGIKKLENSLEELRDLYEKNKKISNELIEECDINCEKERRRAQANLEERLSKIKLDHSNRLAEAKNISNSINRLEIDQKIEELKREYKKKLDYEKNTLRQENEKELELLNSKEHDLESDELQNSYQFHDISNKYNAIQSKEVGLIDKETALKLECEKQKIELDFAEKRKNLQFKTVDSQAKNSDLDIDVIRAESQIERINKILAQKEIDIINTKDKISEYSNELQKLNFHIKTAAKTDSRNTLEELKLEIINKDKIIEKLKHSGPDKYESLQRDIRELKQQFIEYKNEENSVNPVRIDPKIQENQEVMIKKSEKSPIDEILERWRVETPKYVKDVDLTSNLSFEDELELDVSYKVKNYGNWMINLQEDIEEMIDYSKKIKDKQPLDFN